MKSGIVGFAIVAVALLAILLRLPTLLYDGIWRDEANVYVELMAPSFVDFLHRVSAIDYHPPLYFLLEYAWSKIAGIGELAFEALPFACSIATVSAVYLLGKAAASRAVGIVSATFFAVAPLAITYSTDYLYPLATLTYTCLAAAVTIARKEEPTPRRYALVCISSLAAVLSHYTALIFIPLLVIWSFLSPRGIKEGARVAAAIIAGALPFLLWLPVFLHQHHVGLPYDNPPQFSRSAEFFVAALELLVPVPPAPIIIAIFSAVLVLPALTLSRDSLKADCFALGLLALCATAAVSALGGFSTVRYVLPFCTLLYTFFAWLLVSFGRRLRREDPASWNHWGMPAAVGLAVVLCAMNARYALADAAVPHSGVRTFLASVPSDPGTLYLIAPDYMAPTFAYYARTRNVTYVGFARLEHPEYYVLDGYADLWSDPAVIAQTLHAVAARSRRFRYLDVVVDSWAHNADRVPFGKVWRLVAELKRRYILISQANYSGRWEPISVYRFDVDTRMVQ